MIDLRDAQNHIEARRQLESMVADYDGDLPEACRCLTDDLEAPLNQLSVSPWHRQNVCTVNLAARNFVEVRRRTKVISHLCGRES